MAARRKNDVKVVIIDTQYVETDATSFKSVVQKLTGKDSTSAAADHGRHHQRQSRFKPADEQVGYEHDTNNAAPAMSFKDFDLMLKDLPPLDELIGFYAE